MLVMMAKLTDRVGVRTGDTECCSFMTFCQRIKRKRLRGERTRESREKHRGDRRPSSGGVEGFLKRA
jgi:hypothetical protein